MNIISALFANPEPGPDQQMVDFLESEVDADLVEQIRNAVTTQQAGELVTKLYRKVLDSEVVYPDSYEDWLLIAMKLTGREERAGLHFLNSEHTAGEWNG